MLGVGGCEAWETECTQSGFKEKTKDKQKNLSMTRKQGGEPLDSGSLEKRKCCFTARFLTIL